MTELRERPEPTLGELTAAIKGADLILVEGFKSEKHRSSKFVALML